MSHTLKFVFPFLFALPTIAKAQAAFEEESSVKTQGLIAEPSSTVEAQEEDDADEDVGTNFTTRQGKTTAVEVFADYNTFTSKRQYFNPFAYGVRAYWFQSPDIKYGISLAAEKFVFETDLKTATGIPTNPYSFNDIKVDGNALRYALNAQYFVSDSVHANFSLFGANGKTEKKGPIDSETYTRSGLTFGLGNQWSWDQYTFRWDWISLTYNFAFKIGKQNVLDAYPSNTNGGMIILSALAFGAEW